MKVYPVNFPDEVKVRARFYYKAELARMYGISLNTFSSYMKRHEKAFLHTGYTRGQKILNPLQVSILFSIIGEP